MEKITSLADLVKLSEKSVESVGKKTPAANDTPPVPTPHTQNEMDRLAEKLPPGYYGWINSAWVELADRPPADCTDTLTVPGAPRQPVTTTAADLHAQHPPTINGIPLGAILAHAEPEDFDALRDSGVLATFAKSLLATGAIKPNR